MEIGESQTFQVVGSDRNHRIELLGKEQIRKGVQPGKERWRANLLVTNKKNEVLKRPVSLVRRELYFSSAFYAAVWAKMKEAGLPVLPTVAIFSDTEVLETDLTADGSKVFGKDTNIYERNDTSPVDKLFLKISISKVENEAKRVAELAAKNHVGISYDHGFDLLVKPDGSYKVMNRDIKNTRIYDNSKDINQIKSDNLDCVGSFIDHLNAAKKYLQESQRRFNPNR